jgi:limonene-1,2-epoxide hydrolase
MPWFPEFVSAVELARLQDRSTGHADPVAQYLRALETGDARILEHAWPGDIVIHDPKAGQIRGHRQVREFVRDTASWLRGLHLRTETVASTASGRRAVVELLAHLPGGGPELLWPVAVVAESPDDRSVVFRTYCRPWPITGPHQVRPPILEPGSGRLDGIVAPYQAALEDGDTDAIVGTFEPEGYYREPGGPQPTHRGRGELRSFFTDSFSAGGGIALQHCAVTDDGVRCAVEFNCVRWGRNDLPPQAGLGVYERGPDGLLAAVRVYDDVEPPVAYR